MASKENIIATVGLYLVLGYVGYRIYKSFEAGTGSQDKQGQKGQNGNNNAVGCLTIGQMRGANGNFDAQRQQWQMARSVAGQNAYDWEAFRAYERGIGAPDPGACAPQEFLHAVGPAF